MDDSADRDAAGGPRVIDGPFTETKEMVAGVRFRAPAGAMSIRGRLIRRMGDTARTCRCVIPATPGGPECPE